MTKVTKLVGLMSLSSFYHPISGYILLEMFILLKVNNTVFSNINNSIVAKYTTEIHAYKNY